MTAELTRQEAKTKGARKDLQSTLTLVGSAFIGSIVVAMYVVTVCALNQHHKDSNAVDRAAYLAARELSEITVSHPNFGRVGLLDRAPARDSSYADRKRKARVTGLNSLYATLRVDAIIARKLNNQALVDLNARDFKIAKQLEADLTRRMYHAIEQVPAAESNLSEPPEKLARQLTATESEDADSDDAINEKHDTVLQVVSRLLSDEAAGRGPNLTDVRITLGSVAPGKLSSQTLAPAEDSGKEFVKDGMYRSGLAVPLPDGQSVTFIGYPHTTKIIDKNWFEKGAKGTAPWAVQIEAVYERTKASEPKEKVVKSACAVAGGEPVLPHTSAFALTFPHGKPSLFDSVSDILSFNGWNSKGEWQQVVGTEVPGKGSLAPPIEAIAGGLTPGGALAHALYDWLKQMGPNVDPELFVSAMKSSFSEALHSASIDPISDQTNSCLAVDTGSRDYALLNQTNPDGPGQAAIGQCFNIQDARTQRDKIPPPSSVPLVVDSDGRCVLAGKNRFDKELLKDFLSAVYETNLAALESMETAKQMSLRAKSALKELDQKMYFERQELTSVQSRAQRIRSQIAFDPEKRISAGPLKQKDNENLRQYNLAKKRLEELKQQLIDDKEERDRYRKLNEVAKTVSHNASKAGITTYDLCTHSNQILAHGLARTQSPSKGFLLGGRFVFLPQPVPIQEEEFLLTDAEKLSRLDKEPIKPLKGDLNFEWTNPEMHLVAECNDLFKTGRKTIFVEGLPIKLYWLQTSEIPVWTRATFVIDSAKLTASAEKRKEKTNTEKTTAAESTTQQPQQKPQQALAAFKNYAFGNIRIPAGQLMYYCADAVETGANPKVSWSVAIRDLVSSRSEGSMGEPLNVPDGDWRDAAKSRVGEIPGLAAEFQLRTPLPITDLGHSGSYLMNPLTGQQIPQIPPLPSEML